MASLQSYSGPMLNGSQLALHSDASALLASPPNKSPGQDEGHPGTRTVLCVANVTDKRQRSRQRQR
jgi:hypothetical protein